MLHPLTWFTLTSLASATASTSFCSDNLWQPVFTDNFSTLDLDTWTIDLSANDSNVRNARGTADNVYIQNDTLVLRSQRQQAGLYSYTTGAVWTKDKAFWKPPARVCVRAKLPAGGNGIWPAHWLMPNTKACWPTNGEIDVMEMINNDGVLHGTYHWSAEGECGRNFQLGNMINITNNNWNDNWHEYAVEFTMDYIAFVLDGQVYSNVTRTQSHKGHRVILFDVPYYLILNTAVGGPWPKPVDKNTVFPVYHYIDQVTVSRPVSRPASQPAVMPVNLSVHVLEEEEDA